MGRIDQVGDVVVLQVLRKAVRSAEAADPHRDRLAARRLGASGVAEHGLHSPFRHGAGERACFGGAAQDEDMGHD